ncbi:MAG: hypothetical protein ACE5KY_05730, partial [Candidatus Tectimicrobiota bacterium]
STVGPAEEARYRSLASPRAWAVVADALAVYGQRILSFITAGLLMALPLFLYQTWQWRTDQVDLPPGLVSPLLGAALLAFWNVFWAVLMIRLAADEITGAGEGLGKAVSRLSVSTINWAVIAQFLISLATGLASLLLIIPGIIVAVKLSLTLPVVVCEGQRPIAAMRRSSRLVKGQGWSVFGAYGLLVLATIAASLLLGGVFWVSRGPGFTVRSILQIWAGGSNTLVRAIFGPLWAIIPTLFYAALSSRHDVEAPQPPQSATYGTMSPVVGGSEPR